MSTSIDDRQKRGQVIATAKRSINRYNESRYLVKSQSGNGKYKVILTKLGCTCSCPDHKFRGVKCKHIYAVEFSSAIRETVREEVIIRPISQLASTTVIQSGL